MPTLFRFCALFALAAGISTHFIFSWQHQTCEDHYLVLGVSRESTSSTIRKAWHRDSLLLHPDKQRGASLSRIVSQKWRLFKLGTASVDNAFVQASRAYEILSNQDERHGHDVDLSACELAASAQGAARRSARTTFTGSRGLFSVCGACAFFAERCDSLGELFPLLAVPLHLCAQSLDSVTSYLYANDSMSSVTGLFVFLLFVGVAGLPLVEAIASALILAPWRALCNMTGQAARSERKKAEGMARARERQAELFATKKGR